MKTISLIKTAAQHAYTETVPFFKTEEGQIARALNKTAKIRTPSKACELSRFENASKQDLKILLSEKEQDILKRFSFISPETLNEYNIIIKSRNPDGTLSLRILDETGKLVKEASVKPKKVVVLDNFSQASNALDFNSEAKIPHGEIVKKLVQKNNPMNDYEFIDVVAEEKVFKPHDAIRKLIKRLDNGEKIDAVSCSFAAEVRQEDLNNLCGIKLEGLPQARLKKHIKYSFEKLLTLSQVELEKIPQGQDLKDFYQQIRLLEELKKRGVKIFIGSGNGTEKVLQNGKPSFIHSFNLDLFAEGTEGVGAITSKGQIADFSSTRKSIFTPHYENGLLRIEQREKGYNFSGGTGIDVPYTKTAQAMYDSITSLSPYSKEIEYAKGKYSYHGIPVVPDMNKFTVKPSIVINGGTSWATPRRTAEYTKYTVLKDLGL